MKPLPSKRGRRYGYYRGFKNPFARKYVRLVRSLTVPLPASVDLQPQCPPVYDQGQLGSCTANAIAGAYAYERMKAGEPFLTPSRLFIYWNERAYEGDTADDTGAFGGDGIISLESLGVPDESLWPYDELQFNVQPPTAAFTAALPNKVLSRQIVTTLDDIKGALADNHLVVFGISIYESFESDAVAETGIVPDPQPTEGFLGGHEMAAVGFSDERQAFKVRNSWGASWGLSGYCWMSYNFMIAAGSDFEVIATISAPVQVKGLAV